MLLQLEGLEGLNNFLNTLAQIVAVIIVPLKPYLQPIGEWMVGWVGFLLSFFPTEGLDIYFFIFLILVIGGVIINSKWPGDR